MVGSWLDTNWCQMLSHDGSGWRDVGPYAIAALQRRELLWVRLRPRLREAHIAGRSLRVESSSRRRLPYRGGVPCGRAGRVLLGERCRLSSSWSFPFRSVIRFVTPTTQVLYFKCFSSVDGYEIFNSDAGFGDSLMQNLQLNLAKFAAGACKICVAHNVEKSKS